MFQAAMNNAEQMVGRAVVFMLGLVLCSLLLLTSLGFLGYSFFILCQTWLSPAYSALLTGCLFLLIMLTLILAFRMAMATPVTQRKTTADITYSSPETPAIPANPATCLSLAILAGYLYESQPQIKEQVGQLLLDLARKQTVAASGKSAVSDTV